MYQHSLWVAGLSIFVSFTVVDAAPQAEDGVNPFNTLGTSLVDFTYVASSS